LPEHDLWLLVEALRSAGPIALRHWKNSPRTWDKGGDAGPVTEADIAVNDHLLARLRPARPAYGWLSEEGPADSRREEADRVFIIDPIDGTRAFIAGEESFAISAGISEAGRMIAGAVYLPAMNRLYAAHRDGIATLNDTPLRASGAWDISNATMLTSAPNLRPEYWPGGIPDLRRSFRPSLAYRLCLVAEGQFDAMLSFRPTWEWDIAAASLIAERAGARVTNRHNETHRFNAAHPQSDGVLAAPPFLHGALIARATRA
jgi:myo-inositol-1(or 4)-monophosphatase